MENIDTQCRMDWEPRRGRYIPAGGATLFEALMEPPLWSGNFLTPLPRSADSRKPPARWLHAVTPRPAVREHMSW